MNMSSTESGFRRPVNRTMRLLAAMLLCALASAPALAKPDLGQARKLVTRKDYRAAVAAYAALARDSGDAELVAEYAYALALMGFADPSLAQLDRALILGALDQSVLFSASSVLDALGHGDAAQELTGPGPQWLEGADVRIGEISPARTRGGFKSEFAAANLLMLQRRYATALDRFARLTKEYPDAPAAWAGYAIALEKIGAFRTAARAVARERELNSTDDDATRQLKAAHQEELESRPPLASRTSEEIRRSEADLTGRMLFFLGGGRTSVPGAKVSTLSVRAGRFLTDRLDASADANYTKSDYATGAPSPNDGWTYGASGRYGVPISAGSPIRMTAGARLAFTPGPADNLSIIGSPGLSILLGAGSIDASLDFGLEGPLKGTRTLSAGYTAYFGGSR